MGGTVLQQPNRQNSQKAREQWKSYATCSHSENNPVRLGLRLTQTLDVRKTACGGRSDVMIGYMGSPSSATHAAKARQNKSKKCRLEKRR
jgi:hypothetical protein